VLGLLKTLALLAIVGALIVLVARHGGEVTGLGDRDRASLVYNVGFMALVGGAVLRIFRDRIGEAIQAALMWTVSASRSSSPIRIASISRTPAIG